MKLLCFADLHGDTKLLKKLIARAKKEDVDLVIAAGDLTQFESNFRYILKKLEGIEKDVLIIPGNHETEISLNQALEGLKYCRNINKQAVKLGGLVFLGYGEGGFALEDQEFRKIARNWYGEYQHDKVILVTHGPPFGTKLDKVENHYTGNQDFRAFIERIKPKLVVCGHIHETVGKKDKIGETLVINPGWDGMVVEV